VYCSGRRSKQRIQGQRIVFEGKGPRGEKRIYCYCIFHIDQKAKVFALTIVFCWTVISHQSCSPFPSTSVGALGLFTFLPQCTVHNLRISELGVPVYSSLNRTYHPIKKGSLEIHLHSSIIRNKYTSLFFFDHYTLLYIFFKLCFFKLFIYFIEYSSPFLRFKNLIKLLLILVLSYFLCKFL